MRKNSFDCKQPDKTEQEHDMLSGYSVEKDRLGGMAREEDLVTVWRVLPDLAQGKQKWSGSWCCGAGADGPCGYAGCGGGEVGEGVTPCDCTASHCLQMWLCH